MFRNASCSKASINSILLQPDPSTETRTASVLATDAVLEPYSSPVLELRGRSNRFSYFRLIALTDRLTRGIVPVRRYWLAVMRPFRVRAQ